MIVFVFLLRLFMPGAGHALQSTAPMYLTDERAEENLAAAWIAGMQEHVDPALLLSIAWHESRYEPHVVTAERGGKVSCGAMTPEPKTRCRPGSLLDGYLAGAKHLRGWLDATHSERAALLGYAGGYALGAACARGPVIIRRGVDACETPAVFRRRAAWIRRVLAHAPTRW